jgi:nitrate/nitrite transporter NarK
MLRSILVVLGSFVAMALVVVATTALAARIFLSRGAPDTPPALTPAYLATTLFCGALAASLGGWLAARFAATAPQTHVYALAALMVLMSLASMRQSIAAGQPKWYALVLLLLMPVVTIASGRLAAP